MRRPRRCRFSGFALLGRRLSKLTQVLGLGFFDSGAVVQVTPSIVLSTAFTSAVSGLRSPKRGEVTRHGEVPHVVRMLPKDT